MIDSFRKALAVTVVLTVVFLVSLAPAFQPAGVGWLDPGRLPLGVALLALNTLPLLALARNPLAVVLIFCVAYPLWVDTGHPPHMFQSLPMLVALYALGAWQRPLRLRAIGLVAPVWMVGSVVAGWWVEASLHEIEYVAVIFVLGWALGVVVAARRSYSAQLEEKTAALQAAREELARRAVADERARIARELHDVIAHAMSVITVRAGVGAHLVDSRPAEAGDALRVIESTGREALSEMRRMLAVLRDPDPAGPRAEPQPGLADVPRLVEQVAAAGVSASVTTVGEVRALPPGLDLAAYRVAQEALTNVVKHAPGTRAAVTIGYQPDSLHLEIRNPGPVATPIGRGQGIRGMAERVALYDGEFEAVPDSDGFRVSARFPVDGAEAGA